ncbi:hypothetical protein C8R45DRAFT_348401 [Mycena sanguinolenta]|nr:hypothetical protein C8R45DRAFT_348401 [Mycena sanguinolenta]
MTQASFEAITTASGLSRSRSIARMVGRPDDGRRVVYGTHDGTYLQEIKDPVTMLALNNVRQVNVLEEYLLSECEVLTFPLDMLDSAQIARRDADVGIPTETAFFKAGFYLDRVLVCRPPSIPIHARRLHSLGGAERKPRLQYAQAFTTAFPPCPCFRFRFARLKGWQQFFLPPRWHRSTTQDANGRSVCQCGLVNVESLEKPALPMADPWNKALSLLAEKSPLRSAVPGVKRRARAQMVIYLSCWWGVFALLRPKRARPEFMIPRRGSRLDSRPPLPMSSHSRLRSSRFGGGDAPEDPRVEYAAAVCEHAADDGQQQRGTTLVAEGEHRDQPRHDSDEIIMVSCLRSAWRRVHSRDDVHSWTVEQASVLYPAFSAVN